MVISGDAPIPHLPGMEGRRVSKADPDHFVSSQLNELFRWWQSHATAQLPRHADFDITAFPRLARSVFLIGCEDNGYALRLAGEEYSEITGIKKGHHWRRDDANILERDFAGYLDFIRREQVPYYSQGTLAYGERDWIRFEALLCPLQSGQADGSILIGLIARLPGEAA